MAVKDTDKFAVVLDYKGGNIALGFESLSKAISLVEGQIEETDSSKMLEYIQHIISESNGFLIEGVTYNILDAITYFDLYEEDEDGQE